VSLAVAAMGVVWCARHDGLSTGLTMPVSRRATFYAFLRALPCKTAAACGFADKYACQPLQFRFIVVHHLWMTRMFARHFFTAYFYFSNSNPKAVE
jgi:hypothetical protein